MLGRMSERLGRRYRLLLRVYPRGRRRAELLDTLLESAPAGRRRPTVREGVDLVRHGLRARLGRPRSTAVVVFALLVAVAGGYLGAFAAARIGWEFAPALPTGARADQLKATAFPGLHVWGGGDAELFVPQDDGEGIRYGSAGYWVKHTDATRDVAAYSAGARDRLAVAGWRVRDYAVADPESLIDGGEERRASFWATHDGLVLHFTDHYWTQRPSYDSDGAAAFDLWRAEPPWLPAVTWAGALAGAVIAWFAAGWVSRRLEPVPGSGPLLGAGATFALILLLPSTLRPGSDVPNDPWWSGFLYFGAGPALMSGVLAVCMLGSAVAQPLPADQPPGPLRGTLRRLRSPLLRLLALGRRRPRRAAVLAGLAAVAAIGGTPALRPGGPAAAPCHPTGPPAASATSRTNVKIFVATTSTAEERNYISAAIFRSRAGSLGEFVWDPGSPEYRATYCGGARVPDEAVAGLPYFFDVELANAATYPALLEEVDGLPGVVAVQHAAPYDD
jgi:hypothetical protein